MKKTIPILLAILLLIPLSYSQDISSCQTISSPGYYRLTNDIINTPNTCFKIRSNDVIFDCDNHLIDGNKGSRDYGIRTYNYNNITIKNCKIEQFDRGIYVYYGTNIKIINTYLRDNKNYHIYLYRPQDIQIENTSMFYTDNRDAIYMTRTNNFVFKNLFIKAPQRYGIYFRTSNNGEVFNSTITGSQRALYLYTSNNIIIHHNTIENNQIGLYSSSMGNNHENYIYDNYFFNPENVRLTGTKYYNRWYDEPHMGEGIKWNIIAGNYWAKPDGTGFSQTCEDNDENGICDQEYVLGTDNIDVFPISNTEPQLNDWWNDTWAFRRKIKIIGNLVDNYPIYLELNTASMILAGKLRPDCGDLRFVEPTPLGDVELSYFIVNQTCNSVRTRVYVKIPHKSTEYIYMYYGNPTAQSKSNGDTTFLFFDDFQSLNTSKWEVLNNNFTIENGILNITGMDETKVLRSYYEAEEPYIIEYYAMPSIDDTSVDWDAGIGITFDGTNYLFFTDDPAGTGLAISGYAPNLWRSVDMVANRYENNKMHRYKISISSYTSIYEDKDDGRVHQDEQDRHAGGRIAFVIDEDDPNKENDFLIDVIMVYPFLDQEPNLFFYQEEDRNDYPYIRLLSPNHQYVATEDTITFHAIATDKYSNTMRARIYIYDDGYDLYYRSDWTTITNNTEFTFSYSLGTGKWYWNVEVDDQDSVAPKRAMAYEDYIIWKDSGMPSIQITLPKNQTYPTNELNLTTNTTDDLIVRECKYSINNQENITYDCYSDIIQAQEGSNCLEVWAIDLANNTAYDSVCFTTDTDPPFWINLQEDPPQPIEDDLLNTLNLSIEWYADIYPISYVILNFDGTNYTPNSSGNTYWVELKNLQPKIYNYSWIAVDSVGRQNQTNNSYAVCDIKLNVQAQFNPIYHNTFQIIKVYAYYEATSTPMPNASITLRVYDPDNNLIDEESKITDENGIATFNIFLSQDLKTGFYIVEAEGVSPEGFTTDNPITETFQLVSVGLANPLVKINDGAGLYSSKLDNENNYTIKAEVINPSSTNTIERAIVKILLPIDTDPRPYPEGDVIKVYDEHLNEIPFSSDFNEYNMPYIYFIVSNLTANEHRVFYIKAHERACEYLTCHENETLLEVNAKYNLYIEDILKNLNLNITFNDSNILSRLDDLEAILISHIDEALQNQTNNLSTQIYQAKVDINNSIYTTYFLLNNKIDHAILLINSNTNQSRDQILTSIQNLKVFIDTRINESRDLILYSLNNNQQELLYFLHSNFTSLQENLSNYYEELYNFIEATNQSTYHMFLTLSSQNSQILYKTEQILENLSTMNRTISRNLTIIIDNQKQINETINKISDNIYEINMTLNNEHEQITAKLLYINNSIETLKDKLALTNSTLYDLIIFKSHDLNNTILYVHQDLSQLIQEHNNSISSLINASTQDLENKLSIAEQNLNDSINYAVILINNNTNDKYVLLNDMIDEKLNNISIELIIHNDTIKNMLNNLTLTINDSEYRIISTINTSHLSINDTLNYLAQSLNNSITTKIEQSHNSLLSKLLEIIDMLNNITLDITSIQEQIDTLNQNIASNFTNLNNTILYEFSTLHENLNNNFTYIDTYLTYLNNNIANNFTSINAYLDYLNNNIANNFTQTNLLISKLNANIYHNYTYFNDLIQDGFNNISLALQDINESNEQIKQAISSTNQSIHSKLNQLNQSEQQRYIQIINEINKLNESNELRFMLIIDNILSLNNTEQQRYLSILSNISDLKDNITAQISLLNETEQAEHQEILNRIAQLQANITQQFIDQNSLLESNFTTIDNHLIEINNTIINLSYLLSLNFTYINQTLLNINETQNQNYLQLKAIIEATSNDIKNNFTELISSLNISTEQVIHAYFNCDHNHSNQICMKLENIKSKATNIQAITSEIRDILQSQSEYTEAYGIITEENENELIAYIYVKGHGNQRPIVKQYLPCKADKDDIKLFDLSYQPINFNIYKDLSGKYYIEFTAHLSNAYDTETYKLIMKKTYCEIPSEYNIRPLYLQLKENKGLLEYLRDIILTLQENINKFKLTILAGGI